MTDPADADPLWWVYLLGSARGNRTYIGIAHDVERRLRQHNGELAGGARSTRSGRPWHVLRKLGPYSSRSVASRVEHFWKRARGAQRARWQPQAHHLDPAAT